MKNFGTGGCGEVKVHFKEMDFAGRLILLTEHSTYILVVADEWNAAACTIRIPTNEALIAHAYDSTESVIIESDTTTVHTIESWSGLPKEYTNSAVKICGPVGKITQIKKGERELPEATNNPFERRSCSNQSTLSNIVNYFKFKK